MASSLDLLGGHQCVGARGAGVPQDTRLIGGQQGESGALISPSDSNMTFPVPYPCSKPKQTQVVSYLEVLGVDRDGFSASGSRQRWAEGVWPREQKGPSFPAWTFFFCLLDPPVQPAGRPWLYMCSFRATVMCLSRGDHSTRALGIGTH